MKSKDIVKKILTKDTCYGMYDDKIPTEKELINYFALFIEEYAREYHESQTIVDKEVKKEEELKKSQWWNN